MFGVRFGKKTRYCLLDIDITSTYHPCRDAFAVSNLVAALEPLGLVHYIACTSSYSNGIHLYFPFQEPQNSWEVATAVANLLERAGFVLAPGQLEIFPNPRPYIPGTRPSLFYAHRLPLQVGSYLLNEDFQPIWSDRTTFVQRWQFAQNHNDFDTKQLKQLIQSRTRIRPVSGKAEKFLADLNAEIATGWTGSAQTNHLLGRIAMRAYVFHHVLFGGEPLTGQALVDEILATARSLPGYQIWCQHQHEIEKRASEWARCVEGSHYFPYGSRRSTTETEISGALDRDPKSTLSWNQQQSQNARERIKQAIAQLLETNALPAATTARFQALTQFGIGGSSLYRHKDLWHPCHLGENPPDPPTSNSIATGDCAEGASPVCNSTSLFPAIGSNPAPDQASERSINLTSTPGCNSLVFPLSLKQRMQQFLDSGDAILVAEAMSYFQQQVIERANRSSVLCPAECELQNELEVPAFTASRSQFGSSTWVRSHSVSKVSFSDNVSPEDPLGDPLEDLLKDPQGDPPEDLSELLATITVQIRQLGWTKDQTAHHLWQRFGKLHQSRLSPSELVEWIEWLRIVRSPQEAG